MKACRVAPKFCRFREGLESSIPDLVKKILPQDRLEQIVRACKIEFRKRHFTPMATVWLWLWQRLQGAGCREVTAAAFAWAFANDHEPASNDCGGYSKARGRQKETFIQTIAEGVAEDTDQGSDFQAFGRPVYGTDGTTVKAADTEENQQEYPQPQDQKPGCGYPIVRLVGVFSLATGALQLLAMGSYRQSEQELFYSLWDQLAANAIIVADRYFDNYRNLSLLCARGVDCLMKLNANRKKPDFRKCHKRLGKGDALFVWKRPARKDWDRDWARESDHDEAPETLIVRIIRYTIRIPGFRSKQVTLVTTLLDPEQYPAAELAKLYGRRWSVEVDIRDMKTTMGMEFINAKTPEMVRKEIWMYTLGYNVIRQVMQDAAIAYDLPMERVSFKGSQQLLLAMTAAIGTASREVMADAYEFMLFGISQRPVRIRRNRSEPRVLKRRKGKYAYMTRLRNAYDRRPKPVPAELLVA